MTFVNGASKIDEYLFPIISDETTGSVEYSSTLERDPVWMQHIRLH